MTKVAGKPSKCIITVEALQKANQEADGIAEALYGVDTETLTKMMAAVGDQKEANKLLNKSLAAKIEGVLYETSVNFMVSGLHTSKVNLLGHATTAGMEILKTGLRTTSAAVTSGPMSQRAKTEVDIMKDQWNATIQTFKDLTQLGVKTAEGARGWAKLTDLPLDLFSHPDFVVGTRTGKRLELETALNKATGKKTTASRSKAADDNSLDNPLRERAISANYLGFNPKGRVGQGIDLVGAGVNVFGEALRHEDLMGKTFHYRLEMAKQVRHRAEKIGGTRGEIEDTAKLLKDNPMDDMVIDSAQKANQNTFTDELGTFANSGRVFLQKPWMRLLTPFYRTLVNTQKMGIRESFVGEVGRAIHGFKGGDDYYKKLVARTPEGDAARSQLVFSGLMTTGVLSYFNADPRVDGYGFTGHLDMSKQADRIRAQEFGGSWTYRWPDGDVWDLSDVEPVRGMLAFYMTGNELLSMDLDRFDPNTGQQIDTQQQVWDVLSTPFEAIYGDYFAMESFTKITHLLDAMTSNEPGSKARASRILEDITTSFVTPKIMKDVNAAGALVEQAVTGEANLFDAELRRASSMMERIDNAWFGSDNGIPMTKWGTRKEALHGLTQSAQSSLFTAEHPTAEVAWDFYESGISFMDNPSELPVAGKGTRVRINTLQTQEFMEVGGQGGYIEELGRELLSFEDFVSGIMYHPQLADKPKFIQSKVLSSMVRKRDNAIAGLIIGRHQDLKDKVRQNLKNKADMASGKLSTTVPLDAAYIKELFNFNLAETILENQTQ